MAEYIVDWTGIGTTLVHLAKTKPPFLWPKALRSLHRKERVIRCRDCRFYVKDPEPIDPGWPMMCDLTAKDMLEPDGFCAWGERSER